ncbi:carbohydrate-binding module family 20 protein, partial [Sphaerobolus stellatus SS14]
STDVIIQMFEWTWDSVAAECTNFIGPAGYGFVQVSPPQEHIQGSQWWTDYQPVSYILTSKRGNRQQFSNMISTCHAAGVRVIADTLFNHMVSSGSSVVAVNFTHYVYPGIYQAQDFHYCGLEPGNNIVNYDNAVEVQTCQLDNLADLATETEYVRGRLAEYGNDLLSLGVDGFRLDSAKHINTTDIANILSRLNSTSKPYITQEVIYGAGEPITPNQYTGNGDVQEFRYTSTLQSAFSGSQALSSLQNLDNLGWVPGTGANVFVANHDTERNGNSLNYNSASNTYVLATIFSLAHPYGTPSVLSSYTFSDTDDGSPNGGTGTCSATGGTNGWLCQHRWPAFVGMVTFRNSVSGNVTNFVSGGSQQIAFGRGSTGFLAINNQDSTWTSTFQTSLPAGTYCDVVAGPLSNGACQGASITVSSCGTFTATISARNALAIHIGAFTSTGGSVTVNFAETATTTFGDNIFVVGSISQLGNWAPGSSIAMSSNSYPVWTVSVSLPPSTTFQYKYLRKTAAGGIVWESDPNRNATTSSSGSLTLNDSWR